MDRFKRRDILFIVDVLILLAVLLVGILMMLVKGDSMLTFGGYCGFFLQFGSLMFLSRILLGVYANVWRYANSAVFVRIIISDAIGGAIAIALSLLPVFYPIRIG